MMQAMRRGANTWFAKIIFGLLILSFAGWGVQGALTGQDDPEIISVGDQSVRLSEIDFMFRQTTQRMQQMFGQDMNLAQFAEIGLLDTTISQSLDGALFNALTQDMGIAADAASIANAIRSNPAFAGADGQFDQHTYEMRLAGSGYTEAMLVNDLRSDIARQHVMRSLQAGFQLPEAYTRRLLAYEAEKRDILVATIAPSQITDIPAPTNSDLSNFYSDNPDLFTSAELRSFTALDLSADAIAAGIDVPEADIQAQFDFQAPNLGLPEQRTISQIITNDEAVAGQIASRAKAGESLDAISEALDVSAPTQLDSITATDLASEVSEPVFSSDVNSIVGPVQSSFGWHVIRVLDIQEGKVAKLEDYRDSIRTGLAADMALDKLLDITALVEDDLDAGLDLKTISEKHGVPLITARLMDRSGQQFRADGLTVNDTGTPNLGISAPQILSTVFELGEGTTSPLLTGQESTYYAVYVDAIFPTQLVDENGATEFIKTKWTAAEQLKKAKEIAKDVAQQAVQTGDFPTGLAALTVEPHTELTRASVSAHVSRDLLSSSFATAAGDTTTLNTSDGAVQVVLVTNISSPSPEEIQAQMADLVARTEPRVKDDLLLQLRDRLQIDLGAVVDRNTAREYYTSGEYATAHQYGM